ncbi:hypothetical protein KAR91_37940 [Candidatus Pacearchaeota archaeon]|nr:hypothetical protein [Candidatus Pacearchaeota archaeon]
MVYVKVLKYTNYTGQSGTTQRAKPGSVIGIKVRSDLKRILAGGFAKIIDNKDLTTDKNGFIVTADESAEGQKESQSKESSDESSKSKETVANPEEIGVGALVKGTIEETVRTGEVQKAYKDGFLRVKFQGDTENYRRVDPKDLEVIE